MTRALLTAAVATLLALATTSALATDATWNSQGGDLGNTRHAAADPAFTAAKLASLQPLWQVPLKGAMRFAPVSDGAALFVTTNLGHLTKLDRGSGQVLWDVDLDKALDIRGAFSKGNPALADDLVVVAIHNVPTLAAFDKATGKLRWKTAIADAQFDNITQSPLVHDGRTLVGTSGLAEESIIKPTPSQTCCGFRGSMMAFDLASGRQLWRTYTLPEGYFGGAVWSPAPAVDPKRGIVYATVGNAYRIPAEVQKCALANLHDRAALRRCYPAGVWFDSILALDERTGAIKWGFRANDYDVFTGTCLLYDTSGTLLYADSQPRKDCGGGPDYDFAQGAMLWRAGGQDLVGAGQKSGEFWALNANTGQMVWHRVVGPGSRVGGVRAEATDGERVYLATGRIIEGDVQFAVGIEPPGPPTAFIALDGGSVTMPNRAFWPGHSHQYDDERAIACYEERARGGYGLIVTSRGCEGLMAKIAPIVQRHGTKIFHQGWYPQNTGLTKGVHDRRDPSLQPSVIAPGAKGVMSKEMEEDEIEASIEQAALWAKRMQEAGADGVELHLSHMHWPSHWLTASDNRRTEQYGGSIENRLRFELRTLEAVRQAVSRDFVIGLRRNGLYDTRGGPIETREDSHAFARLLADSGLVDFLSISGYPNYRGMGTPAGAIIVEAAAIKQAIGSKLIIMSTGDRVVDPRQAEQFLADDKVDMVGLVRAGIADPEIIAKAKAGRLDDIRTCVGSGQGCLGYWYQGPSICTQNPTVGYEGRWGADKFAKAPVAKKVLVIGGGPAGLEAALTAARRGHQVTLCEKEPAFGGQINPIRNSPRRGEFYNVVSWRMGQLSKLGVPVKLSTEMTAEKILAEHADLVVLATGGRSRKGLYPGSDLPHVFTPWDVMLGKLSDRKHVVVLDAVNYHQATDPIEYLAARNVKVTVVTAAAVFCEGGAAPDWPTMWESLQGKDLTIHLNTKVVDITEKAVHCVGTVNVPPTTDPWYGPRGPVFAIEGADAVVLAIGTDPVDELYKALKGRVPELVRIGDCLAPRGVEHATYEGRKIGWSIGDRPL